MTGIDLFWMFLVFISLQPLLRRRFQEFARKRMIMALEHKRKSRVIIMMHRQETMAFLGFPIIRYIDINDSEEVIRAINLTDDEVPIDLVLHTPGGLVLASLQIAQALNEHPAKVTVFVPHHAMSGGTLIALGADEIVMSREAVLGPVDPQVGQFPAASLLRAVARKPVAEVDDNTLILADQAEKAIAQVEGSVRRLLEKKFPPDKAQELASLLSKGTWTHDYPITFEAAKSLGLPVSAEMPREILDLMALYPQPVRYIPTVEYFPYPKHREPS
jgi:ClpP class serine protease